ncbi:MAG: M17 family peptidase N-terminal domain-containing protein, partial [Alphaproteobacteria bacterium]
MAKRLEISFVKPAAPTRGCAIFLVAKNLGLGEHAAAFNKKIGSPLARASKAAGFDGEARKSIEILAPAKSNLGRAVFIGIGDAGKMSETDWLRLGGTIARTLRDDTEAAIVVELPGKGEVTPDQAATLGLGMVMRNYRFDTYKTKTLKKAPATAKVRIQVANPRAVSASWRAAKGVSAGIELARNLVNEPANVLGPIEFADRLKALTSLGLEVKV